MKKLAVVITLFLLYGCVPSGTLVKDSASDSRYYNPAGTFGSQVGGENVELQTPKIQYFLEPPLNISETPLPQVLQIIFARSGAKYVIEGTLLELGAPVLFTIEKKENLDDILRMILSPKAVKFEIDNNNVYHIKMNLIPLGR